MTTRRVFVVIFALSLFAIAVRETTDPDMWWHLRTGQLIVEEGIPRQDPYSYTVPDNKWITHEWLSEVIMWVTYRAGSFSGLIILFALLTALSFWLVYLRSSGKPYLAAFVVLLAALSAAPFWGAKPQVFNILFTAGFVFVIEGWREGVLRKKWLWVLPILTLLWANLHSGYLLGIAIIGVYLAGDSLDLLLNRARLGRRDWSQMRLLFGLMLVCLVAAVVNPNGPELWTYPFFTLGSNAMQQYIQEWHSPDFHSAIFWPFLGLALAGTAGFVAGKKKIPLAEILLFSGTAIAGLVSARHIPLFAIVSSPIITRQLSGAIWTFPSSDQANAEDARTVSKWTIVLNWTILLIVLVFAFVWVMAKIQGNQEQIRNRYPNDAIAFLREEGLDQKHIYNSYNWGGYLIWEYIPVFVDGRADVYGDDFLYFYRKTFDLTPEWRQPLDQYNAEIVLIEARSPLQTLLSSSGEWQILYVDPVAAILARSQ